MKCSECQAELTESSKFCQKCGAAVASPTAEVVLENNKNDRMQLVVGFIKKYWKIILGVLVAIVILANLGGNGLNEAVVERTVLELMNEQLLSDWYGVKATDIASLDLKREGKVWEGSAIVMLEKNNKKMLGRVEVLVYQKSRSQDCIVEVSLTDDAKSVLRNL